MFRRYLAIFPLLFFISAVIAADSKPPSNDELVLWVKQLGNDDFTARIAAEDKLRAVGEVAVEAAIAMLEGVSNSTDEEVHMRSNRLLLELRAVKLEKQLISLVDKAKGFEAKIETSQLFTGAELKLSGNVRAHPDCKRYACKWKYELDGLTTKVKTISDGATLWVEYDHTSNIDVEKCSMGRIERSRMAGTPLMAFGVIAHPAHSMKTLPQVIRFTQMEESRCDGVDVLVFSGSAREDAQATLNRHFAKLFGTGTAKRAEVPFVKARLAVGKADGIVRKAEIITDKGEVTCSMTLSDVKTVAQMEDGEFKYTLPAKAVTMDLDKFFSPED
jgi:hypothetical protein